jgi:hypothetical protein
MRVMRLQELGSMIFIMNKECTIHNIRVTDLKISSILRTITMVLNASNVELNS